MVSVSRDTGVSSTRTRGPYGLEVEPNRALYATVFLFMWRDRSRRATVAAVRGWRTGTGCERRTAAGRGRAHRQARAPPQLSVELSAVPVPAVVLCDCRRRDSRYSQCVIASPSVRYNHVNRATEVTSWSRSGVVKSSGSYAPVESILSRTDSMRAVTIRREDVERESDRSRSLLLSIHAEASSARRALSSGLSPLFPTPISYRSPCLSPISHARQV